MQLKNEALKSFLHQIVPIFEMNGFPIQKFSCNPQRERKSLVSEKLIEDLLNSFDDNEMMFLEEGNKVWYNLKFSVFTTPDNQTNVIEKTVIVDKDGVKAIGNNRVKASKRFFRIGIMPDVSFFNTIFMLFDSRFSFSFSFFLILFLFYVIYCFNYSSSQFRGPTSKKIHIQWN